MWLVRIYALVWLAVASAVAVLHATDAMGIAATMVLGFTASVLAGMGILTVYPVLMAERVRGRG
jgi:hypothetical protein